MASESETVNYLLHRITALEKEQKRLLRIINELLNFTSV
jgi:hypothetical protein